MVQPRWPAATDRAGRPRSTSPAPVTRANWWRPRLSRSSAKPICRRFTSPAPLPQQSTGNIVPHGRARSEAMSADFDGKVVLVTGAGSGIGREAARLFVERGAHVFAADLNLDGLEET